MMTSLSALRHWLVGPDVLLFLLNVALASCLIGCIGLLAVRWLRHRPAPLRHGLLVAVLILMLVSPMLFWLADALGWGVHVPVAAATSSEHAGRGDSVSLWAQTEPGLGLATPDAPEDGGANPRAAWGAELLFLALQALGTLLLGIWGVGTAVMVVGLVRGLGTLAQLRASFLDVRDSALRENARESLRLLGIRQRVELHHTPLTLTPFSLGLIKPRIILPAGLAGCLDAEQLRYVLLHEAAHIRRRDHWVALLQYVCTTVFWWNSLLHAVNARLMSLREQICDDHVISAGGDGRVFAEALVRVAEWGAVRPDVLCSAALMQNRSEDRDGEGAICRELEERIVRLVRRSQPREVQMSRASWAAVAAFGLLVSAALPIAGLRAAASADQGSPDSSKFTADQGAGLTSPVPPVRDAVASQQPGVSPPVKHALATQWVMLLPAGFAHWVTLTPLGSDRYRLEPSSLNSSGVYEVQGRRLVIVQPNDRRLSGFQWEIHADGHLTLVGQPPLRETGSNYLGATMVPAQ